MERAVRMLFANIMFDTWLDASKGMYGVRQGINSLAERLGKSQIPNLHSLEIQDYQGLLQVNCQHITADTDAVRSERGCAIFSILPDAQPGIIPRFSPNADEVGATHRPDTWRPNLQSFSQAESHDADPLAPTVLLDGEHHIPLFGPAVPSGAIGPSSTDADGPLFPQTATTEALEPVPDGEGPLFGPNAGPTSEPLRSQQEEQKLNTTAPLSLKEAILSSKQHILSEEEEERLPARRVSQRTLALSLVDPFGRPLANLGYKLTFANKELTGKTDEKGHLEIMVPIETQEASLNLRLSQDPGHEIVWPLHLVDEEPEELVATRNNLHILGYQSGSLNNTFDAGLALALKAFQEDVQLKPADGSLNLATQNHLEAFATQSEVSQ